MESFQAGFRQTEGGICIRVREGQRGPVLMQDFTEWIGRNVVRQIKSFDKKKGEKKKGFLKYFQ